MTVKADLGGSPAAVLAPVQARPLIAQCRAQVTASEGPASKKANAGRWRLNAGSEMRMTVWGVNMRAGPWGPQPEPIRCVIDMASAEFDKPVIPAFYAHIEAMWSTVGNWSNGEISASGIVADLTTYTPRTDAEADMFAYAVAVKSLIDQGHPWEASVGAYSALGLDGWELVPAGATVQCNGRSYDGAGDEPLYILRSARVCESSVVMYGADRDTGRLAAGRHHPQGIPMTTPAAPAAPAAPVATAAAIDVARIKTLRAAHPGQEAVVLAQLEAGKTDAEIALAVKDAELVALRAELAASKANPAAPAKPVVTAGASETREAAKPPGFAAGSEAAATGDFMRLRAAIGVETKLKGMALNEEVYRRHPNLRPAV